MKRFTGTEKWDKPWFRRLSPKLKCLWFYIVDRCDCAGIWDADWETASHFIGQQVSIEDTIPFENRLETLGDSGKLWVTEFCKFQYGALVESCKPHAGVIFRLQALGLYDRVIKGLPNPTGKGKGKGKEGGMGETVHPQTMTNARVIIHYLNEKVSRQYREVDSNLKLIIARLKEPGVTVEGVKLMVDRMVKKWGTDPKMSEYLRPATLFGKEKFDGYYAAREEPLPFPANPQPYGPPPHNGRNPAIAKELLAKEAGGQQLTNRERQLVIFHSGVCE